MAAVRHLPCSFHRCGGVLGQAHHLCGQAETLAEVEMLDVPPATALDWPYSDALPPAPSVQWGDSARSTMPAAASASWEPVRYFCWQDFEAANTLLGKAGCSTWQENLANLICRLESQAHASRSSIFLEQVRGALLVVFNAAAGLVLRSRTLHPAPLFFFQQKSNFWWNDENSLWQKRKYSFITICPES